MAVFPICTCLLIPSLLCAAVFSQLPQEPSISSSVYQPTGASSYREYNDVLVYPENPSPTRYFNNKLDFETIDGNILIGAADNLHLLNTNLDQMDTLAWPKSNSSCLFSEYVCRNHIRMYEEIPGGVGGTRKLLICGTRVVTPECRTVEITNNSRFGEVGISRTVPGLISAHPDLPGFGEFRRSSTGDMTFFGANFITSNTRTYDFAYYNVSVDNSTGPSAQKLYGFLTNTMTWLNFPVVFVDYRRKDYPSPSSNQAAYQFYFVFLRENFQIDNREVLYSRVVRICRNDPGTTASDSRSSPIFSTYLKARIFCFREMPPGTEYVGAQDFEYNEIWSLSFNSDQGGRYHADGEYNNLMYAAFSGPLIGPPGMAICVYPAYPAAGQDTLNNGIFDIFRGDVTISKSQVGGNTERQNTFTECSPQGRNESNEAEDIQIIEDISQLGDNPLLIKNGVHVSQIVVDEVCVVKKDNRDSCVNQDALFLGTDTGLVYKVIMATVTKPIPGNPGNPGVLRPVIVDEIQLDDSNSVDEMKKELVGGEKYLYVGTASRIYRLPLENCARFGANFSACIGSKDPYCVWDSVKVTCRRTTLSAIGSQTGTVPSFVAQNIHTGTVNVPQVSFKQMQFTVSEIQDSLLIEIISDAPVLDNMLELVTVEGTARAGYDYDSPYNQSITFQPNVLTSDPVSITIIPRSEFTGNRQFTLRLRSTQQGALSFRTSTAIVTILDEEAIVFQLAIGGLEIQTCATWILFEPANNIDAITGAVLSALDPTLKLEDYPNTFQHSSFFCTGKLSNNQQEFAVFRSILDITKLDSHRSVVINSLMEWIVKKPSIRKGLSVLGYSNECDTVIFSVNQSLCSYDDLKVEVDTGGLESTVNDGTAQALGAVVAVSLIVNVVVICILILVIVLRKRSTNVGSIALEGSNEVEVIPKKNLEDSTEKPQTPTTATSNTKFFTGNISNGFDQQSAM